MIVVRKTADDEERVVPNGQPIPRGFVSAGITYKKSSVYLLTEKGERRASGSYYTPNDIVDDIVDGTLGAICDEIDRALQQEIANTEREIAAATGREREALNQKLQQFRPGFDIRVLKLRVLDPAMGSGHFFELANISPSR